MYIGVHGRAKRPGIMAPVCIAMMLSELFYFDWISDLLLNHWFLLAIITPGMLYTDWLIHYIRWLTLRHRTADMNIMITVRYGLMATVATNILPDCFQATDFKFTLLPLLYLWLNPF